MPRRRRAHGRLLARLPRGLCLPIGLAALAFFAAAAAAAETGQLSLQAAPGDATPEEIAEFWSAAVALERAVFEQDDADGELARERLSKAAALFARVGQEEGGATDGYWRAARATWLAGDILDLDDIDGRLDAFRRALALADRGLAENPDCAGCMLWKFICMGRLRTTQGLWEGVRQVGEMAALLDRAIALEPTHRDSENNSMLGNLHYSSAIFYRIVPDWFWIRWVLGVKGDKQRALEHSRKALALHPNRLDFQIEVGTQLLCLGTLRGDPARLAEGRKAMLDAIERHAERQTERQDDRREVYFARLMLAEPERSCGYSGDKLLEMDEEKARRATAR